MSTSSPEQLPENLPPPPSGVEYITTGRRTELESKLAAAEGRVRQMEAEPERDPRWAPERGLEWGINKIPVIGPVTTFIKNNFLTLLTTVGALAVANHTGVFNNIPAGTGRDLLNGISDTSGAFSWLGEGAKRTGAYFSEQGGRFWTALQNRFGPAAPPTP